MPISAECLQLVMNIINVFILPPLAPPICYFVFLGPLNVVIFRYCVWVV